MNKGKLFNSCVSSITAVAMAFSLSALGAARVAVAEPAGDAAGETVTVIVQLEEAFSGGLSAQGASSPQERHRSIQREIEEICEQAESVPASSDAGESTTLSAASVAASAPDVSFAVVDDYYNIIDGFAVTVPASALQDIRNLQGVKNAFLERTHEVPQDAEDVHDTTPGNQSSLDMTQADDIEERGDGQVIAVIDSGVQVTHEAFSGAIDATKAAWGEDALAQKRANLVQGGKDAAYISEKIPFAYDYADDDADAIPANSGLSHGTHVASIATANAGEVRGTAPNAQLCVMKVARDSTGRIPDTALFEALDDAVVLEPDVINLSLGSDGGFASEADSTYSDAYAALEEAGITVCNSAGNSGNAAHTVNGVESLSAAGNPDNGLVSSPASVAEALAVASIDNSAQTPCFTMADGTRIGYTDAAGSKGSVPRTFDDLADGTYEYLSAGTGSQTATDSLLAEHAVSYFVDKVVVIEDGFYDENGTILMAAARISNVASALKPAAIIISATGDGALSAASAGQVTSTPVACISHSDGQALAGAATKTIVVAQGEAIPASTDYAVSDFSSWGPTPELTLKPEVAAPGGDIYAAVLDDAYGCKSGTSMASPHMAGIAALVREHVGESSLFDSLSSQERRDVVTQLVMSTAKPVVNQNAQDGYYSPRQQGAGIVNAQAAVDTEVYVTVAGAAEASRPKAELGASDKGAWSFTVVLHNLGASKHVFNARAVALSEKVVDGSFSEVSEDYAGRGIAVEYGGAAYDAQSGTVNVPAGGQASVTVSLTCEDAFKELVAAAENGSYVDGFVLFEAVSDEASDGEAGVDLSVPFLGFYGDWGQAPVFDALDGSGSECVGGTSFVDDSGIALGLNPLDEDDDTVDYGKLFVSNVKGARNQFVPRTGMLRSARSLVYEYVNAAGETVRSYTHLYTTKSLYGSEGWTNAETNYTESPAFNGLDDEGLKLEDGTYTLRVTATTAGPDSREQVFTQDFTYDTTAPEVTFTADGIGQAVVQVEDAGSLAGIRLVDRRSGTVIATLLDTQATRSETIESATRWDFDLDLVQLKEAWTQAGLAEEDFTDSLIAKAWDWGMNEGASSTESADGDFTIEDGVLTGYSGSSTYVVVPDGITGIGEEAFASSAIKGIFIPASVKSIGRRAFYQATSLASVSFEDGDASPSQLTEIGSEALAGSGVLSMSFPSAVETLGKRVLADSKVVEVSFPASLAEIPQGACNSCADLRKVAFADGISGIGASAFLDCSDLTEVVGGGIDQTLPSSVNTIGDYAFKNTGLRALALAEGLEAIGASAFAGTWIGQLVVPNSVTRLSDSALGEMKHLLSATLGTGVDEDDAIAVFSGSTELRAIEVADGSQSLLAEDGVLFDAEKTRLLSFPLGKIGSYEVPDGIGEIAEAAFAQASLSSVAFPSSLVSIGESAFASSRLSGQLVLPAGSFAIGKSAFSETEIESVDIGGATSIGESAFASCTQLAAADLRTDRCALESVGANAFAPDTPLGSVVLPDSVTSVGAGAFANNAALTKVHLGAGISEAYSTLFSGCENIAELSVSADSASYYADGNVLYVKQSDGMHLSFSLPGNAFTAYTVAAGTVQIDKSAFKDNKTLETLVLPEGLKTIESGAFNGCSALANVSFPDSLSSVNGFYNTAMELADFGTSIQEINKNAFIGHNPAHLVVRGGNKGTYGSSSENGSDKQPIKTAYFGEGMVKADFTTSRIAPPELLVVPSTLTSLSLQKATSTLSYDVSAIEVYAPKDTTGWTTASAALTAIGADPATQLKAYTALSVECVTEAKPEVGAEVQITAKGSGGLGAYEYRFVQKAGDGTETVLQDWGAEATCAWTVPDENASVSCEVRDATWLTAAASVAMGEEMPAMPTPASPTKVVKKALAKGATFTVSGITYKVTNASKRYVTVTKVSTAAKTLALVSVKYKGTSKYSAATYKVRAIGKRAVKKAPKLTELTIGANVAAIGAHAFAKAEKLKTLVVKCRKLTKTGVKNALKGSQVATVKVSLGTKKLNRTYVKKYKKFFTKANAGKKATVKS